MKEAEKLRCCDYWIARYNDCENPKQQEAVRQQFIHGLAMYYGGEITESVLGHVAREIRDRGTSI